MYLPRPAIATICHTCEIGVQCALDPAALLSAKDSCCQVAQLEDVRGYRMAAGHEEGVYALPIPSQLLIRQRPLCRLLHRIQCPSALTSGLQPKALNHSLRRCQNLCICFKCLHTQLNPVLNESLELFAMLRLHS